MPVHNSDIAEIFNEIADLLEIQGDNPFRVRAYRNASRSVSSLERDDPMLTNASSFEPITSEPMPRLCRIPSLSHPIEYTRPARAI